MKLITFRLTVNNETRLLMKSHFFYNEQKTREKTGNE